jgi:hypothetical protein
MGFELFIHPSGVLLALCCDMSAELCCCCCCAVADGTSHGVFFLNSNGMDVLLNKTSVTFK